MRSICRVVDTSAFSRLRTSIDRHYVEHWARMFKRLGTTALSIALILVSGIALDTQSWSRLDKTLSVFDTPSQICSS